MNSKIYTIGYSSFERDYFAEILAEHNIGAVIDVRSSPYSEYYSDYDRPELEAFLISRKIYYRNYAHEFGARQENTDYHSSEGYVDFEKFALSQQFREGVDRLINAMRMGYVFVLMCAEKNPVNCHRAILVSRAFHDRGCEVRHILPLGEPITQKDLERELLEMYFSDRAQGDLFTGYRTDDELIQEAYRLQNAKIGWRPATNKEGQ